MRHFFLAAALIACACGAAEAQAPAAVRIDATRDAIGRITTPVYLNGQGPFNFVVDTGANRSAISHHVATRLGLEIDGVGQVHAFTGVFQAPMVRLSSIRSGALLINDITAPVIDGPMLSNADGLLGVDTLGERRLIFDLRRSTVSIDDGLSSLAGRGWVNVPGQRRFGNLIVARGRIGRISTHVIIDTGAQTSIVNGPLRNALAAGRGDARPVTGTRITSVADPIVLNEAVFIPRLDFGAAALGNVTAYSGDLYIFELWGLTREPAIVIGMDVVRHMYGLAMNYRRARVEMQVARMGQRPRAELVH